MGGGGGQSALHMDVKALDPLAADSKETSPKGSSAKVRDEKSCGGIEINVVESFMRQCRQWKCQENSFVETQYKKLWWL